MTPGMAARQFITRDANGKPRPVLCLVTDRRRLAAVSGAPLDTAAALLERQVEGAVEAHVDIVHVRERDLPARDLTALVSRLAALTRGTGTRLLVNDRIDVALAARADGVHLREDSVAPGRCRGIVPAGWTIGRSVHGPSGVAATLGADFLVAGTVFPTVSKPDTTALLGVEGLAAVVRAAAGVPVLAIGGITGREAPEIGRTGAAGVASIGAFLPKPGEDAVRSVQERALLLRRAFDRLEAVP